MLACACTGACKKDLNHICNANKRANKQKRLEAALERASKAKMSIYAMPFPMLYEIVVTTEELKTIRDCLQDAIERERLQSSENESAPQGNAE